MFTLVGSQKQASILLEWMVQWYSSHDPTYLGKWRTLSTQKVGVHWPLKVIVYYVILQSSLKQKGSSLVLVNSSRSSSYNNISGWSILTVHWIRSSALWTLQKPGNKLFNWKGSVRNLSRRLGRLSMGNQYIHQLSVKTWISHNLPQIWNLSTLRPLFRSGLQTKLNPSDMEIIE